MRVSQRIWTWGYWSSWSSANALSILQVDMMFSLLLRTNTTYKNVSKPGKISFQDFEKLQSPSCSHGNEHEVVTAPPAVLENVI